jgi:mevalonate kinase
MTLTRRKLNGKFLLTGEYAVLDGALAVAVPLNRGQSIEVAKLQTGLEPDANQASILHWRALNQHGTPWFEAQFALPQFTVLKSTDEQVSARLRQMLVCANAMNPSFLSVDQKSVSLKTSTAGSKTLTVTTRLDFDRNWGLGTSSTLVALLADWAGVNPYQLLEATMGGSGYDIACAMADGPITYQRNLNQLDQPKVHEIALANEVTRGFYFIYLNQKMNSREAIQAYRAKQSSPSFIQEVSDLSQALVEAKYLPEAQKIITAHEALLGARLGLEPVQASMFKDFAGAIKSMGAWGGDFVLAATEMPDAEVRAWFGLRGFDVVFAWDALTQNAPKG